MEDSVTFSTDSEDSILALSKLDSKDLSFGSPATIVSKLNALNNLKYNVGGGHDKLAELFRKDLISAMKLPDTESLQAEEYHLISDPWRQDWERGVQVPINPDDAKEGNVVIIKENEMLHGSYAFKLPKKFLHATQDETFKQGMHELHGMQSLADEVCRYDLDNFDSVWLRLYNELRSNYGEDPLDEWVMERVMEQLETQCYDGMQEAMKTVEGLGIEYDEDIVCDVCRSPEVEEGNEMVFCDGCDICVHQACYGIVKIPKGNWMCKTCVLNVKPNCVLCPNVGGALKATQDGLRWAHLNCAIWIPEVTIGCSETMQPIKGIDEIPATRWALICTLCRERSGACIQCCVKKCKTAFHVTCAFQHNLEMKVNLEDDNSDVQLKGYCPAHSKRHDSDGSPRKTPTSTPKKANEMTEEERTAERSRRLQKLAEEFHTYVDLKKVSDVIKTDKRTVDFIYCYWMLKRKCNFNKPLLTPKVEEGDLLLKQQEDTMVARLKMFIHLRQDLERVRNLCYMVTKREKLRTQLHRVKMQVFLQQSKILRKEKLRSNGREYKSISTAHKQMLSIYDQPEKVLRTAEYFENANESDVKTPGSVQRLTPVVRAPGTLFNLTPVKAKPKPKMPAENPYAKPTYKSFSWMLSARRRSSHGSNSTSPEKQVEESLELAGWQPKRRRGRRPKPAVGLERTYGENILKMDNENASVCDVSGDISIGFFQNIDSIKTDLLSNDKLGSTKQETCPTETDDNDPCSSTKVTTCVLETNQNSRSDGANAPEAAKINIHEDPSRGGIVAKQPILPQKKRRGRPPKIRVILPEASSASVCEENQIEDAPCFRRLVNCSDNITSLDISALKEEESDGMGEVSHEKEVSDCTVEEAVKLEVLEEFSKPDVFEAVSKDEVSKDEQGRNPNVESNSTDSVEHPTEFLENNCKSESDRQDCVTNDIEPCSSPALQLLGSNDVELCRTAASPHRPRHFSSLDPLHLDNGSTSPSSEPLIKPSQNDKCCKERQCETLLNSNAVVEIQKVACILQISRLEHSGVSAELKNSLLERKKCAPMKTTRPNGKRRPTISAAKLKLNRSFGGKRDAEEGQRSGTPLHLKENGLLKNRPTMERFLQQVPEKVDTAKRNGSLHKKHPVTDEACVGNRTEKTEAADSATEERSQSSDSDTSDPSERLCTRSAVRPPNLPHRKRRVHSDSSNVHSKKRLRYAKGGKESVPPGGTSADIDHEGQSKLTELKDVDSELSNGFSPVLRRRYRTRQSLGPS